MSLQPFTHMRAHIQRSYPFGLLAPGVLDLVLMGWMDGLGQRAHPVLYTLGCIWLSLLALGLLLRLPYEVHRLTEADLTRQVQPQQYEKLRWLDLRPLVRACYWSLAGLWRIRQLRHAWFWVPKEWFPPDYILPRPWQGAEKVRMHVHTLYWQAEMCALASFWITTFWIPSQAGQGLPQGALFLALTLILLVSRPVSGQEQAGSAQGLVLTRDSHTPPEPQAVQGTGGKRLPLACLHQVHAVHMLSLGFVLLLQMPASLAYTYAQLALFPEGGAVNHALIERIRRVQWWLLGVAFVAVLPLFGIAVALGILQALLFFAYAYLWCLAEDLRHKYMLTQPQGQGPSSEGNANPPPEKDQRT